MAQPSTARRRSRFWLIFPFFLLALIIAAYSAYWFYARGQLERAVDEWIAAEQANGAVVEYSGKTLGGFPYRFALTIDDPVYEGPGGARWEAEQLQLVMQPWNWNHVIGRSPGRNLVTDPSGVRHTINLDRKSVASLSWTETAIRRFGLELSDADALIDGQTIEVDGFSLNFSPTPDAPDNLRISLQWEALTVPNLTDNTAYLGNTLQPSRLVAEVEGFFPAYAATGGRMGRLPAALTRQEGALRIGQLLLNWGPLKFGAKGDIAAQDGVWSGEISVRLDDAAELRRIMEAEAVPDDQIAAVSALEVMSEDGNFLTLTVKDNGIYYLGQRVADLPGLASGS